MDGVRKWRGEIHRKEAGGRGKKARVKQGLKDLEHPSPGALTTSSSQVFTLATCLPCVPKLCTTWGEEGLFSIFISQWITTMDNCSSEKLKVTLDSSSLLPINVYL